MALLLNVPYAEKDEAKALGAKWDTQLKKWYVEDYRHYSDFYKWIEPVEIENKQIICNSLFIIEKYRACRNCKNILPDIIWGTRDFIEIKQELLDRPGKWTVIYDMKNKLTLHNDIKPIPPTLITYLKEKYNFEEQDMREILSPHFYKRCRKCGIMLESFFFEAIKNEEDTVIYEFPLKYDIVSDYDIWGTHFFYVDKKKLRLMPTITDL